MHQLDHAVDNTFEDVNRAFQAIIDIIEQRRDAVISNVKKMRDEKKKVLQVSQFICIISYYMINVSSVTINLVLFYLYSPYGGQLSCVNFCLSNSTLSYL